MEGVLDMNDSILRQQIRNRLIECRIESGKTQKEIGAVVGKSPNAVASWEQGLSLPDIETLYRLSKYYEKSLQFMYGLEEKENDN